MAFANKRQLYEALPAWLKRAACVLPFEWIAGSAYRTTLARHAFFERASREDLLAYQEARLKETLLFATDQVPAYRRLRSTVDKHRAFDALREFPYLDKATLQSDFSRYLPRDIDRIPHYAITTGGTTGNQLHFFVDDVSQAVENAFQHRLWRRVGYSPRKRRVTFRGVPFPNRKPGVYWQHNPIYNELQFSPFHMSDSTLGAYVDQIVRFRPEYIYGYPSAIDLLAEFVLREGLGDRIPRLRAALLISEGVGHAQRRRIEAALRTRVFSFYGHSERVLMGGECEANSSYHHFPDYGILEIVDDMGEPCTHEGQRGELVGTGLLNRSLPLIRYRTGDLAVRCSHGCECGRQWDRFTDVVGRWRQEMIVGMDGARISLAALNMHGDLLERVVRFQYFQEQPGLCEFRVVPAPGFTQADAAAIKRAFSSKVAGALQFSVRIVDEIPLTTRGKLKLLDSRLNAEPGEPGLN